MLALLALIVVLAIHSLTLDGAAEGVKFYLLPDFQRASQVGLGKVITSAMVRQMIRFITGIPPLSSWRTHCTRSLRAAQRIQDPLPRLLG